MERGVYISAVGGKLSPCTVAYQIIESLIDSPGNVNKDGGGDPSFYFVLDLGAKRTVSKLVIRNAVRSGVDYTTKDFSISMSIDSSTNNFGPQVTGTLAVQDYSLQEVPVGLTGRYLKFKVLTYGPNSAALKYVAIFVSD
jgi:hypothetical protein